MGHDLQIPISFHDVISIYLDFLFNDSRLTSLDHLKKLQRHCGSTSSRGRSLPMSYPGPTGLCNRLSAHVTGRILAEP
jgi:hypothetical protein